MSKLRQYRFIADRLVEAKNEKEACNIFADNSFDFASQAEVYDVTGRPGVDHPQDEYNGWPNRLTWVIVVHIQNDEGLLTEAKEAKNPQDLEERIEQILTMRDENDETSRDIFLMDVVGHALVEVDWVAIYESINTQ